METLKDHLSIDDPDAYRSEKRYTYLVTWRFRNPDKGPRVGWSQQVTGSTMTITGRNKISEPHDLEEIVSHIEKYLRKTYPHWKPAPLYIQAFSRFGE